MEGHVVNRRHGFHPAIQVPRHPVGGTEKELLLTSIREVEESRVLEKSADDTDDSYPIADAWHAGAEATDAPHDQIDFHSRLGRRVECLDDLCIDDRIQFGNDPRRFSFARV